MKSGAIYAHYSPGKGREKSTTIEAQMAMCRQMAAQDQVWIDDSHIYIERGISGGNIDCPNYFLQSITSLMRLRLFSRVLTRRQ